MWGLCMKGSLCSVLGRPIHGGKFALGFKWTYAWREVCVRLWVGPMHGGLFLLGFG